MPLLLMRNFPGTLLDQSCRASVRRQIDYGRERGVPWGISESAYAFTDRAGNYQYRAFGVPGPRAEARAVRRSRGRAVRHGAGQPGRSGCGGAELRAARARGARWPVRLLRGARLSTTALPATPSTPPDTSGPVVVRAFFAHHQGMSLVALANVLCDDTFVKRFHADPRVQATELLLQERVPREAILSEPRPAESTTAAPSLPVFASRRFRSPHTTSPHTHFLSNGRYTAARHARRRRLQHVARPGRHAPARRSHLGRRRALHLPARSRGRVSVWSATYQPFCQEPDEYEATFELDKSDVPPPRRRLRDAARRSPCRPKTTSRCGGCRSPIAATGRAKIEVTSYAEIVLARPEDDLAHPAFGKLFIETEYDPQSAGLLFSRRPRSAGRSADLGVPRARRRGTARRRGRMGDRSRAVPRPRAHRPANPIALDGRALSGTTGAVLDPIAALRERVRLAPGAFVRVTFATGVAPDRAAALALARKYRDGERRGARVLDGVHARAHHAAAPGSHRRPGDALRSPRLARVRLRRVVHQPGRSRAQHPRAVEPVGLRHLRRPADRARARRRRRRPLPLVRQLLQRRSTGGVKGLRADVVILNEHPADYLDEMQNFLAGLVQEPRWAGWLDKPGGMFLLAVRRDARAGPSPPVRRRARRPPRRPRRVCRSQLERPAPWLFQDEDVPPTAELRSPAPAVGTGADPAAGHGERPRRLHARRPRVRRSCSTAIARRRCPGRTSWPTRSSAPSSAARARRSPGPRTAARTG